MTFPRTLSDSWTCPKTEEVAQSGRLLASFLWVESHWFGGRHLEIMVHIFTTTHSFIYKQENSTPPEGNGLPKEPVSLSASPDLGCLPGSCRPWRETQGTAAARRAEGISPGGRAGVRQEHLSGDVREDGALPWVLMQSILWQRLYVTKTHSWPAAFSNYIV